MEEELSADTRATVAAHLAATAAWLRANRWQEEEEAKALTLSFYEHFLTELEPAAA